MREIMKQLDKDIEIVMDYMKNEAHIGFQCECGGSYYEEPPCEKYSDEWFARVKECMEAVFEGIYMYADYLKGEQTPDEEKDDEDYPDGFEF